MSTRPAKPQGMSWASPYLTVKDAQASLNFYTKAFGFEKKEAVPGPDGKIVHAEMTWRDAVVMFGPEDQPHCEVKSPKTSGKDSPVSLYLYCEDVDGLFDRAKKAGATPVQKPQDQFYGDRTCALKDPNGYVWHFAKNVADFDPTKAPSA